MTFQAELEVAREFWQTLSYSKQSWHVLQVTGAKKAEPAPRGCGGRSRCCVRAAPADPYLRR